ncbi:hypothetical protein Tco_1104305 [Tanacetum coccineum]
MSGMAGLSPWHTSCEDRSWHTDVANRTPGPNDGGTGRCGRPSTQTTTGVRAGTARGYRTRCGTITIRYRCVTNDGKGEGDEPEAAGRGDERPDTYGSGAGSQVRGNGRGITYVIDTYEKGRRGTRTDDVHRERQRRNTESCERATRWTNKASGGDVAPTGDDVRVREVANDERYGSGATGRTCGGPTARIRRLEISAGGTVRLRGGTQMRRGRRRRDTDQGGGTNGVTGDGTLTRYATYGGDERRLTSTGGTNSTVLVSSEGVRRG